MTNPAKTSVRPKARMIGHAVGAGSSIVRGVCAAPAGASNVSNAIFQSFPLSSNHVDDRKNDNPNRIHEMPVERQNVDTFSVFRISRFPKAPAP